MIHQSKCRCVKEYFEIGLKIEEYLEKRTTYGSEEWENYNKVLQYIYDIIRRVFPLREDLILYHDKKIEESNKRAKEIYEKFLRDGTLLEKGG